MFSLRKHLVIPAAAMAAMALGTTSANAATVDDQFGSDSSGYATFHLTYTAAPGENNRLGVSKVGNEIVFQDSVPVTVGSIASCYQGTPADPGRTTAATCDADSHVNGLAGVIISAGDGANEVTTVGSYSTTVSGTGASSNVFNGGNGPDSLTGGGGDDTLISNGGEDRLFGAGGEDQLIGGPADDDLDGGAQNDTLIGGSGSDVESGGTGHDTSSYASRSADVKVWLDGLDNDGESGEGDNVQTNVEAVSGGHGDDELTGQVTPVANDLYGNGGDDKIAGGQGHDPTLAGGPGRDEVAGGAGNDGLLGGADADELDAGAGNDYALGDDGDDSLIASDGSDSLIGGDGFDTATYASRTAPVSVDLDGSSGDDGAAAEGDTVTSDVEGVVGGSGADTLVGNDADNVIHGGDGADDITGGLGRDQLFGEFDVDVLHSRDGVLDELDCGAGIDTAEIDDVDGPLACETVERPAHPQSDQPQPEQPQPQPAQPQAPANPANPPVAPATTAPSAKIVSTRATLRKGTIALRVSCAGSAGQVCSGTVSLSGKRGSAGRSRFAVPAGATRTVNVRLSKAAIKSARNAGTAKLTASVKVGTQPPAKRVIRVRAR